MPNELKNNCLFERLFKVKKNGILLLVYLGINSFSQRISKINGSRKFRRFDVVLELEFEVKD